MVSIHVPTRGTTILLCVFLQSIVVSIHVPTRGTTGEDRLHHPIYEVSIHVPTRGTTISCIFHVLSFIVSIHVSTRGTTFRGGKTVAYLMFQSTFPRGERLWLSSAPPTMSFSFNPRSHEGNDDLAVRILAVYRCFNPRSHEGNDWIYTGFSNIAQKFQSTFPRGERRRIKEIEKNGGGFNPRSHEGNDGRMEGSGCTLTGFNPRSHEGNDYFEISQMTILICFNPRSHEGNDGRGGGR